MKHVKRRIFELLAPAELRSGLRLLDKFKSGSDQECPCCGFVGAFLPAGRPPRAAARCPSCRSLERHRLLFLAMHRGQLPFPPDAGSLSMLHFAPEDVIRSRFEKRFGNYVTADLMRDDVDLKLNIEKIELDSDSFDIVLASHIFEHVDDRAASAEIRRILKPGGALLAMVPIIEAWEKTYENSAVASGDDRHKHFGQPNHVRFYGADFADRIEQSGLKLESEIVAFGEDCVRYGLSRGEKVFVFRK